MFNFSTATMRFVSVTKTMPVEAVFVTTPQIYETGRIGVKMYLGSSTRGISLVAKSLVQEKRINCGERVVLESNAEHNQNRSSLRRITVWSPIT
jgi:hypothetical protein